MWELLILIVLLIGAFGLYNSLVRLRELAEAAWADIDVHLKRRYDLIPNLVETVRGCAAHEKDTLEAVIAARAGAMGAGTPEQQGEAENILSGTLKSLFALSESYPRLQSAEPFPDLQAELSRTEDQIHQARRYYNAVVRDLNNKIHQVPTNVLAHMMALGEREFFEINEAEKAPPRVSFGDAE